MNSEDIFLVIEEIAATKSKKGKERILAQHVGEPEFMRVLCATLDPRVTYGIAQMPDFESKARCDRDHFDESTWEMLRQLAARELTGNRAKEWIADELGRLHTGSHELLQRILTKDLRAGFSAGTVNRVVPGAIFSFDCMLAHPFEEKRIAEWPAYVEPKLDGWRALAFVDLGTKVATFHTRNGNVITIVGHLKAPLIASLERSEELAKHGQLVVDGEILSGSFNDTASSLQKKSEQATDSIFVVFDILTQKEWDSPDAKGYLPAPAYEQRMQERGSGISRIQPHLLADLARLRRAHYDCIYSMPSYQVDSMSDVHDLYSQWRALGLEGAIIKAANGRYRKDRDYGWMKLKAEQSVDVPIIGAVPGTGKYVHTLGAIVVDFRGIPVNVSGMSDQLRDEMWAAFQRDQAKGSEELLGRIAEIEFHEETPDGSLRHPRFKRFRDDKAV